MNPTQCASVKKDTLLRLANIRFIGDIGLKILLLALIFGLCKFRYHKSVDWDRDDDN